MEGDKGKEIISNLVSDFYPRPHMEGDVRQDRPLRALYRFLPTPSHGGRLAFSLHLCIISAISTHALTWRATLLSLEVRRHNRISTHALTWRATLSVPAHDW